jgi:hypothetical protein
MQMTPVKSASDEPSSISAIFNDKKGHSRKKSEFIHEEDINCSSDEEEKKDSFASS